VARDCRKRPPSTDEARVFGSHHQGWYALTTPRRIPATPRSGTPISGICEYLPSPPLWTPTLCRREFARFVEWQHADAEAAHRHHGQRRSFKLDLLNRTSFLFYPDPKNVPAETGLRHGVQIMPWLWRWSGSRRLSSAVPPPVRKSCCAWSVR